MPKDEICSNIVKLIKESDVNPSLTEQEIHYIATLMCGVLYSDYETRHYFYSETRKLVLKILEKMLSEKELMEKVSKLVDGEKEEEPKDTKKKIIN
jgi:uncharacterized membrane protein YoaT (DUF817 family)